MTTYDGRAASFVPGREVCISHHHHHLHHHHHHHQLIQVPNREPPVSKFVVEKLYKVILLLVISLIQSVSSISSISRYIENEYLVLNQ